MDLNFAMSGRHQENEAKVSFLGGMLESSRNQGIIVSRSLLMISLKDCCILVLEKVDSYQYHKVKGGAKRKR
jgi:hypothetical protein